MERKSVLREGQCRESRTVLHAKHGQVWVQECGSEVPFYCFSIGRKRFYNLQAKELSCFLKIFSVEFKLLSS